MKKKVFELLVHTLKDNFTLDELSNLDKMLRRGELLSVFIDSVRVALLSKESDALQKAIDEGES